MAPSTDGVAGPIAADRLPEKVTAMREAIMAAARSGDIEALKLPLEWNELKPEFSSGPVPDPIAYWKSLSGDGGGRQILAILLAILEQPFAVVDAKSPRARYVWPEFAEVDPTKLSPAQEVQVYRLVSPADLTAMRARKTWTWYRLSIGADGTWHSFLKTE